MTDRPQRWQSSTVGFSVCCPFCLRAVLPDDGLLHLLLAPRLAYHLWDEHPYEAAILLLHLQHPPARWPEAAGGVPTDAEVAA